MQKYYLIVWEEVPEDSYFYLIPTNEINKIFSAEEIRNLHHKYINMCGLEQSIEDNLEKLSNKLVEEWAIYKIDDFIKLSSNQWIEMVIITGFLL